MIIHNKLLSYLPHLLPLPNLQYKVDLSDILHLHNQAIWYHRQALYLFTQNSYSEAVAGNNRAIALYSSNADFHALAGKLWALQGVSWQ